MAAARRVLGAFPDTAVLVLSMAEGEAVVLRALHAGALGYLLKGAGPGRARTRTAGGRVSGSVERVRASVPTWWLPARGSATA